MRTGGRGEGNSSSIGGAFREAKYEIGGGKSEGGAGIHFPLTPFSARPARAVWFLPRRRRGTFRDFVQKRFALRSVIATKLDIENFRKKERARFARALGGFYSDFPPQSAKRPTNPSRLFWQAGSGSELRSNSQMKFVSNFFLSAEGGIRSQFLIPRFTAKGD